MLARIQRRVPALYLAALSLFAFLCLLRRSIVAYDTDLWYHLNAGRYIWQRHAIPSDSFFSFLSPPRPWLDYYWLFQAVVFRVYSSFGYNGLIFWRAVLFLGLSAVVSLYILKERSESSRPLYSCFLGASCLIVLLPRCELIRPHAATYLLMAVFLYILEFDPGRAFLLPLLSLLWSNLHGVAFPVMLAICGAYLAEHLLERRRKDAGPQGRNLGFLLPVALSMWAACLTPHGLALLDAPFRSLAYASRSIGEFQPLTLAGLLSLNVSSLVPSHSTVFNLLFFGSFLAALISFLSRRVRASHLLLWGCGLFLLTKGNRFMCEFALLSLPLLKANPFFPESRSAGPGPIGLLLLVPPLLGPFLFVRSLLPAGPRYPLAPQLLPEGVAAFLQKAGAGGRMLNDPNTGGYLQWMLYPRYKIEMDLEIPFLFTDEDLYLAQRALEDENVLRMMLLKYDPAFIAVRLNNPRFREVIRKFLDFAPVFFDDNEILYVNRRRRPSIAAAWEWKILDPWELYTRGGAAFEGRVDATAPLLRMLRIYPDAGIVNDLLARIWIKGEEFEKALPCAESLVRNFPNNASGFELKAAALKGLRSYGPALRELRLAAERAAGPARSRIFAQMGLIQSEMGDYADAYRSLKEGLDVFSARTSLEELRAFGLAALRTGREDEAAVVFRYMLNYRLAPGDGVWKKRVEDDLLRPERR